MFDDIEGKARRRDSHLPTERNGGGGGESNADTVEPDDV